MPDQSCVPPDTVEPGFAGRSHDHLMDAFSFNRPERFPGERGLRRRFDLAAALLDRLNVKERRQAAWIWYEPTDQVHWHPFSPICLIGRGSACDLRIDCPLVSRRHAKVTTRAGRAYIEDTQSTHGTRLNGTALKKPTRLRPGDCVEIGGICLVYFGNPNPPNIRR